MSFLGLKNIFKRSNAPPGAHTFTDEDRELSRAKQLRNSIQREEMQAMEDRLKYLRDLRRKQVLQEQIDTMESDLFDTGDDDDDEGLPESPDQMLMQLFTQVMQGQQPAQQMTQPVQTMPQEIHLSDDDLLAYRARIPRPMLKKLQKMSDDELLTLGRQYAPDIFARADEDTLKRALKILKS